MLAERGFNVISADLEEKYPHQVLNACYSFTNLNDSSNIFHPYLKHQNRDFLNVYTNKLVHLVKKARIKRNYSLDSKNKNYPKTNFYRCDSRNMELIADQSIDISVYVSALEHNLPYVISEILRESKRCIKIDGLSLHTTSAIRSGS